MQECIFLKTKLFQGIKKCNKKLFYLGTNIIDGLWKGIQLTKIGKGLFQKETVKPEPLIIFLTDGRQMLKYIDMKILLRK